MFRYNFNTYPGINTTSASQANEISKEYYNYLLGEINKGTTKKAVCKKTNTVYGTEFYHLISVN